MKLTRRGLLAALGVAPAAAKVEAGVREQPKTYVINHHRSELKKFIATDPQVREYFMVMPRAARKELWDSLNRP